MSVTITIAHNRRFCLEHGLEERTFEPCYGCEEAGRARRDCPCCEGKGHVCEIHLPFELNLANGNFSTLWAALGFDAPDCCGSVAAHDVLLALDALDEHLLVRADQRGYGTNGAAWIYCGIRPEQAQRYLSELRAIAREADNRCERLVFG